MTTHTLKCWTEQFAEVRSGRKTFEFRRNDRGFALGDVLDLREFDSVDMIFSGQFELRRVTHILSSGFGVPNGFVVMSMEVVECCGEPVSDGDPCGYILECCGKYRSTSPQTATDIVTDTKLLEALSGNYWDLRCISVPTGGDDYDVDWIVVEHHMAKPTERMIAQAYRDDPRAAIRRAIHATDPNAERCVSCDEVLHDGDSVFCELSEGGHIHSWCVTDNLESYVDVHEQPLKEGSALPEPFPYKLER